MRLVRNFGRDMADSKAKKTSLSLKQRFDILKAVDKVHGHGSKSRIAKEFGIANSTLSTIIKERKRIEAAFEESKFQPQRKRIRSAKYEDIESGLLLWFKGIREKNLPVSGPILQTKAEEIAKEMGFEDFSCSSGWIHRFKIRHAIVQKRVSGEAASVSEETVASWQEVTLPSLLADFAPEDVFNVDETGLFFKLLPDSTLAFKGETCHGGKRAKERITVLVGGNADGSEKLPLLVIGKSKNPRCFKSVHSLPVDYTASKKAWMNSEIFMNWLQKMNRRFVQQSRNVLFIVDNCPAHPVVDNLSNMKVVFSPPNATSRLQPMDQGVIHALKAGYRKKLLSKMIAAVDEGKDYSVTLLNALHFLNSAWNAVTQDTVANCFKKGGFFKQSSEVIPANVTTVDEEMTEQILYLQQRGVHGLDSVTPESYITFDDSLETMEELTTKSIAEQVQAQKHSLEPIEEEEEEEDCDDEVPVPVTLAEAENCTEKLRRFFQSKDATHDFFRMLDQMEGFTSQLRMSSKQTVLTDFFSKC